ncbi:MAG: ATP-dependent DNA helicase RecG [Candidatus Omnitrophica bacterium]|nr:ATP-dependent DNA helicase RecG [Candidatus Omnitrophota bacterium]
MLLPEASVRMIPGVGPQRMEQFIRLGISTVEELIFHFPRKYLDRRQVKKISEILPGEIVSIKGEVVASEEKRLRRFSLVRIAVSDGTGTVFLIFFNQNYIVNVLKTGIRVFVYGKVEQYDKNLQINNPLFEVIEKKRPDYILPVYSTVSGLSQNFIRKCIKYALKNLESFSPDILPLEDRSRLKLSNMKHAITNIHFPQNQVNLERARRHLIFDEFFKLQLALLYKKICADGSSDSVGENKFRSSLVHSFQQMLPFRLTDGQIKVIEEILNDLNSGKVLNRLVQGEVGSGKTVIAIFFVWLFAREGFQCVFLAPTEIRAEQHYLNWRPFFLSCGIECALLIGSLTEKMKREIRLKTESNELKVLFGTHALLNEKITYPSLKAVVVDEQHKFGVEQRNLLQRKGFNIHYLAMSATPIPRSVALAFYGSIDLSTLGSLPRGKRNVVSYLFSHDEIDRVYEFIKKRIQEEKQGYFVAPTIESSEGSSATHHFKNLSAIAGSEKIRLLHGRLSGAEKFAIIEQFRRKEIFLIVSTTVIEVGLDVPDANFIIIDQSERFGLSQLHQMRGRVGRTGETGYCILIHHTNDPEVLSRLESFLEIEDALKLAEIDLSLRGPGDLLGVRQHGVLPLRIGNIMKDIGILTESRKEAERILKNRLYLNGRYARVNQYLQHVMKNKIID